MTLEDFYQRADDINHQVAARVNMLVTSRAQRRVTAREYGQRMRDIFNDAAKSHGANLSKLLLASRLVDQ